MPLGTLDGTPPPFFRQGPSALSKLVFFSALALLLMVADLRFHVINPLRSVMATALYPVQWLALRPVVWGQGGSQYFESLSQSQSREAAAKYQLGLQSQRAQQVEQLTLENTRLRDLLEMRARINSPALAAQVLYEAADPYTRKVIIDKGALAAVTAGAPVLDEVGILGQVTRVYPMVSEVTLITDPNQAIPVLNVRTGVRGLAFGNATVASGTLELRYMDANVEMAAGDLLTTSGVDGIYPPGLQVGRVLKIERRPDSAFARITAQPVARLDGSLHVLVLQPLAGQVPAGVETDGRHWHVKKIEKGEIKLVGGGDVVGKVPSGLPAFRIPPISLDAFLQLLSAAVIIALVAFMESISMAKALAAQTKQRLDPNQELIGQGLANIVGSFF